jgi:hypothetical protein
VATGGKLNHLAARPATLTRMRGSDLNRTAGPDREHTRDPLDFPEAVIEFRRRPMSERLELAISWNLLASELAVGLSEAKQSPAASE